MVPSYRRCLNPGVSLAVHLRVDQHIAKGLTIVMSMDVDYEMVTLLLQFLPIDVVIVVVMKELAIPFPLPPVSTILSIFIRSIITLSSFDQPIALQTYSIVQSIMVVILPLVI